ncbi:MAG: DNA mismatch repair protein MutS [Kofleriaceae bacterium]
MRQYLDIKDNHPDGIVLFRLGDFYEMFFEDAVVAARLLDLTLTSRDKGKDDAVPMCGVPHHSVRGYIAKLTELGHKVVICEQVEDPKLAKGLVKREVVRIVTPGVVLDDDVLEPKLPRYLAALVPSKDRCGLAYLDATTGELAATQLPLAAVLDELVRIAPREVIAAREQLTPSAKLAMIRARYRVAWNAVDVPTEGGARAELGALLADRKATGDDQLLAIRAAATVVGYARATQPTGTLPIVQLAFYQPSDAVVLDEAAIANLELVQTLIGGHKRGSLLDVIDRTETAPGGRRLRRWLLYPLIDVAQIRRRQDAIAWLVERPALAEAIRRELAQVADLERLAGKATLGIATPRDLGKLRDALGQLPGLIELVRSGVDPSERAVAPVPGLLDLAACSDPALAACCTRLGSALTDIPPALLKDGNVIRSGYDTSVDECRALADGGKDAILAIEAREQQTSGISNLKVRYNRVFGYYIEVTKTHLGKVPAHYVRKQTIATGERYVTPELADLERKVLTAEQTLATREAELFRAEVTEVARAARELAAAGGALAVLDACAALADVAARSGYCRPTVDDSTVIDIVDGRHPVIEAMLSSGEFVPNDCKLDVGAEQLVLITGPNMAGKSTYMRQVAQIVLLAQIGSFVPAKSARIGVCDRLFTRVGAADNLSRGDSTFMVEMRETASILDKATARSLVILDEVGRGTSTFDGVSIAWAVTEHIHDVINARTLFATHYHELVALSDTRPRVRNVSVAVREHAGDIVFLRRVVPGGANKSYGIDVARLAGLPKSVITRGRQIMSQLEGGSQLGSTPQLSLLPTAAPSPVLARLASIDVDRTTPLDALQLLAELKALI